MVTNLNKATIGTHWKIIKLASSHFCESLTYILSQSLQQGVVPDILKISKVTPIDKGGEVRDPTNFPPISTFIDVYCEKQKFFFDFNLAFEKDIQLPKL